MMTLTEWFRRALGRPPTVPLGIPQVARILQELPAEAELPKLANHAALWVRGVHLPDQTLRALRSLNPLLKVLHYLPTVGGDERLGREHPEWVVRNAQGQPLQQLNAPTGVLLDPGNPGVRARIVAGAVQIVEAGYDGPMMDEMLMVAEFRPGFDGVNPRTGAVWTKDEFRAEQLENARAVRSALPAAHIAANSIGNGAMYFPRKPFEFAEVCDSLIAEGFRGASDWPLTAYWSRSEWLMDVQMLGHVGRLGSSPVANAEFDVQVVTDPQALDAYTLFMYCTFLLGVRDGGAFSCSLQDRTKNPAEITPLSYDYWKVAPGAPRGDFFEPQAGVFRRDFENLVVLAREGAYYGERYSTGGRFWDLVEERWVREVTLGAHQGKLLLR